MHATNVRFVGTYLTPLPVVLLVLDTCR